MTDFTIQIRETYTKADLPFFTKKCTEEEYKTLKSLMNERVMQQNHTLKVSPLAFQTIVPVRTHNFNALFTDLFLPNFVTGLVASHNIFCIHFGLIVDILSLPIRILTLIPRLIYNRNHQDPVKKFLIKLGANPKEFDSKSDILQVQAFKQQTSWNHVMFKTSNWDYCPKGMPIYGRFHKYERLLSRATHNKNNYWTLRSCIMNFCGLELS